MITADEARALDPSKKKEADLEKLDRMIRAAAEMGRTSLRVPYDMTDHRGYEQWFKTPGVEEALVAAGFTIHHQNEDRQFVDLWIEIRWDTPAPA